MTSVAVVQPISHSHVFSVRPARDALLPAAVAHAEREHHPDHRRQDEAADRELGDVERVDDIAVDGGGPRPERDPVIHRRLSRAAGARSRRRRRDAADHRRQVGNDERGLDRQAVAAELRRVAVAQQQQLVPQSPTAFPSRRIGERALQLGGLRGDAEHVAADAAVGSRHDKAGRMNVLIERRLVPIRETDDIGDTLLPPAAARSGNASRRHRPGDDRAARYLALAAATSVGLSRGSMLITTT